MTKKSRTAAASEPSKPAPAQDPGNGRFLTGNNGGGRPKGSRNKLGEDFLSALQQDFAVHGADTITKVREERPHEYLKIVAGLLPKELNVKTNAVEDLTDDELEAAIELLRRQVNSRDDDVPPQSKH